MVKKLGCISPLCFNTLHHLCITMIVVVVPLHETCLTFYLWLRLRTQMNQMNAPCWLKMRTHENTSELCKWISVSSLVMSLGVIWVSMCGIPPGCCREGDQLPATVLFPKGGVCPLGNVQRQAISLLCCNSGGNRAWVHPYCLLSVPLCSMLCWQDKSFIVPQLY